MKHQIVKRYEFAEGGTREEKESLLRRISAELGLRIIILPDDVEMTIDKVPPRSLRLVNPQIAIDPQQRDITVNGVTITPSPVEFLVLLSLARRKGNAVTTEQICQDVFGLKKKSKAFVRTCVRLLRLRIEPNPKSPSIVCTVRRVGYRLNVPGDFRFHESNAVSAAPT